MLQAVKIKQLIVANIDQVKPLSAEHIHAFLIPPDDVTTTEPIIVIGELPVAEEKYGNNGPIESRKQIQLVFYYPKNYQNDESAIEQRIKDLMLANGLYCFSDAGHVMTPDTNNMTNTLKFTYKEEL